MAKGKEMDSPKTHIRLRGEKKIFHIFNPFQSLKIVLDTTHSHRLETIETIGIDYRAIITSRQIISHTTPF